MLSSSSDPDYLPECTRFQGLSSRPFVDGFTNLSRPKIRSTVDMPVVLVVHFDFNLLVRSGSIRVFVRIVFKLSIVQCELDLVPVL
jgi:hypothetical protein